MISRKVFDGALGKLVQAKGRAVNDLEKRRVEITIRAQELKEKRQKDFSDYKKRYEIVTKAQTRLNNDPERSSIKRKLELKAQQSFNKLIKM